MDKRQRVLRNSGVEMVGKLIFNEDCRVWLCLAAMEKFDNVPTETSDRFYGDQRATPAGSFAFRT